MGSLRARQEAHGSEAAAARRRMREGEGRFKYMTPARFMERNEDEVKASWSGGPTVLAFLFAQPDWAAIQILDTRGEYFDLRTGDTWDLFFPGYFRSEDRNLDRRTGARPVGRDFAANWYFRPNDFDELRAHVERESKGPALLRCG